MVPPNSIFDWRLPIWNSEEYQIRVARPHFVQQEWEIPSVIAVGIETSGGGDEYLRW